MPFSSLERCAANMPATKSSFEFGETSPVGKFCVASELLRDASGILYVGRFIHEGFLAKH